MMRMSRRLRQETADVTPVDPLHVVSYATCGTSLACAVDVSREPGAYANYDAEPHASAGAVLRTQVIGICS